MHTGAGQIGARLLTAAIAVVGVSLLVFLLVHVVPGDPVEIMLGEQASAADRAELRAALGLDRPLARRWGDFMGGLVQGDLGTSFVSGQPVAALVATHARMTASLAGAALLVALALGLPLGLAAALGQGRAWDRVSTVLAVVGMSVPNFVLGPLLILLFAVTLGILPSGGAERASSLVLPALTLGLTMAAFLARMTRAALCEVLQQPYIRAARARGLDERRVVVNHVLRNAALPILATLGLQCGSLLGGAVVTEVVFAWPGLGQLTVEAIQRRDYAVVQGCVLVIALSYVLVNTATDLLAARCDPRLREAR